MGEEDIFGRQLARVPGLRLLLGSFLRQYLIQKFRERLASSGSLCGSRVGLHGGWGRLFFGGRGGFRCM